jgi:hypothetical protein
MAVKRVPTPCRTWKQKWKFNPASLTPAAAAVSFFSGSHTAGGYPGSESRTWRPNYYRNVRRRSGTADLCRLLHPPPCVCNPSRCCSRNTGLGLWRPAWKHNYFCVLWVVLISIIQIAKIPKNGTTKKKLIDLMSAIARNHDVDI